MKRVATTPQTEPASRQKQEDVPSPIVDNNLALKSNNWVHCFCALDWGQKAPHLVWQMPKPPADNGIHSPSNDLVLKAFELTPLASVKAVVISLCPYEHEPGKPPLATGLAMSVPPSAKKPQVRAARNK